MTRLRYVKLVRGVHTPALPERPERFETPERDAFEAHEKLGLESVVEGVRISGEHGVIVTPWANVLFAREEPQPNQTETAKAAASTKARGATSK